METAKFATHCIAAAIESAAPRILLLNISPNSTQTTGPPEARAHAIASDSPKDRYIPQLMKQTTS